jgi:hypothetical protein
LRAPRAGGILPFLRFSQPSRRCFSKRDPRGPTKRERERLHECGLLDLGANVAEDPIELVTQEYAFCEDVVEIVQKIKLARSAFRPWKSTGLAAEAVVIAHVHLAGVSSVAAAGSEPYRRGRCIGAGRAEGHVRIR